MDYERGMRVKLGRIAFTQLFVSRIAPAKDISVKRSREGCEIGISRLRDRKRCYLLGKAGPCQERKRGTKAMPEERTPIHSFPFKGRIENQGALGERGTDQEPNEDLPADRALSRRKPTLSRVPDHCAGKNFDLSLDEWNIADALFEKCG
jgi:hypothetical protein